MIDVADFDVKEIGVIPSKQFSSIEVNSDKLGWVSIVQDKDSILLDADDVEQLIELLKGLKKWKDVYCISRN